MDWIEEIKADPVQNAMYVREQTLLEATEAICEAMQAQGVTQDELRKRLAVTKCVTNRHVRGLLDGKKTMQLGELADVARVLGCRVRIKLEKHDPFQMTPDQREQQRRSFAYGNVHLHNGAVTREDVDRAAEELER